MAIGKHRYIRHDLIELAAAYAEYSVFVTTAELDLPGPQILYANSAFTRMTGYSVSELLGKTPRILQGPKTDKVVLRRLREALLAGHDFIARAINYRRDGTAFELEWIISHLKDSDGRTTHYIAMQRDITGQDRAHKELSAFDDELREASNEFAQSLRKLELAEQRLIEQERFSALGEMTAGVVHDIGNALTPVFGLVQLLHGIEGMPPAAANYVSQLQSSTHHALQVLTNLKNYYRSIDASKVRSQCNLRSIVEMVPDLTKSKWWSKKRQSGGGITFALDLQDVPDIEANETELAQVLINLVHNAVDAMPEGGVISVKLRNEDGQIVIRVSDTGNGVPQEVIDRCFEPYVTTRAEGSGLGLSVCRRIVTDHDGTIELTQQIPHGSCFTIRLPIMESGISKTAQDRRLTHDRRILHIDNNTAREDILSNLLRQLGHHVDVVRSGDEGLRQFYESNYDIVIAGSGLHPTSGFEVAQAIKRRFPEMPVVISMNASETLREDNLPVHLRPDAFLRTPASSSELESTLRELGLWNPVSSRPSERDLH